jgi:hypothetical protein
MGRTRSGRRVIATLLMALAAAGVGTAAAYADTTPNTTPNTVVEQPFAADSGDTCKYGVTKGTIFWTLGPFVRPAPVAVKGTLIDRPLSDGPSICPDDRRFSVVTFTAFAGTVKVDEELVRADNQAVDYGFRLINETSTAPISHLVVVVCRHFPAPRPAVYCGARQIYRAPVN